MESKNCGTCARHNRFMTRRGFPGVECADCKAAPENEPRIVLKRAGRYFDAETLREVNQCGVWSDKKSVYDRQD